MIYIFVRVVKLKGKPGLQEELRRIGREVLVPVNKNAGCVEVYFLEPNSGNEDTGFGVVSVWENREKLEEMKQSESYQDLIKELRPLIESIEDEVYFTLTE